MHRLAALALLAAASVAQVPTYPHVVLTQLPGTNPAAQLIEVDPTTGAAQPLARFPSDTLPPLAVAIDPFDWSVLVALNSTGTQTHIVRLERLGATFVEFPVGSIPGPVTAMAVQQDDVLLSVDGQNGGLYRIARRGGTPTLVLAQANATALHSYASYGGVVLLAWTGRPGSGAVDSGVAIVDTTTGTPYLGPYTFPNPTGLELTGAIDLATALPRQLLSFADGTFALFVGILGPPQPVLASPAIPPGGAVAMNPIGASVFSPVVLGGTAFPFLYDIDPWLGFVTVRSVALPGAPVDFASGPARSALGLQYSPRCGATVLTQGWSGLQQAGTTFTANVVGPANDHAMLTIGLTDFASGTLPFALPGTCRLEVSPDAVVLHLLGANGAASQNITVPAGPGFLGTILFSQWLHFDAAGVSVSGAVAHQIGL